MKSSHCRIFPQRVHRPLYISVCSLACSTCSLTSIVKSDGMYHQCHFMNIISTNFFFYHKLPYGGKISRVKNFEVDLPQNILRIKFRGSTRLSLHLYAIIRFLRINFWGSSEIHENSKIYCPWKIPAIRYLQNLQPSKRCPMYMQYWNSN